MSHLDALKARPDTFVVLFPTPWATDESSLLKQVHGEVWMEEAEISLGEGDDEEIAYAGEFELDGHTATLVVESAIPELVDLAPRALDPFAASEMILLEQHASIWRVALEGGPEAARRLVRIMSTFVESGAAGVFIPANVQIHSPRTVKRQTMDPESAEGLTNLLVSAWHAEDWMRTRGMTAFGFPEIETSTDGGLNGAYFRVMDVAANTITRGAPFPPDSDIDIGHESFRLVEGPRGLDEDPIVPISGHFGVQTIVPK